MDCSLSATICLGNCEKKLSFFLRCNGDVTFLIPSQDRDGSAFLEGRAPGTNWRETPASPVSVNNRTVLQANLLASACFRSPHPHQILIQEGFKSAGKAYNDAIRKSQSEFLIFLHQDMILPEEWIKQLEKSLDYLEEEEQSGSSARWFVCRLWSHVWSASARKPH